MKTLSKQIAGLSKQVENINEGPGCALDDTLTDRLEHVADELEAIAGELEVCGL